MILVCLAYASLEKFCGILLFLTSAPACGHVQIADPEIPVFHWAAVGWEIQGQFRGMWLVVFEPAVSGGTEHPSVVLYQNPVM